MNLFVADPAWGWWIIGYFYLGGIAAGAYFLSTLIDLVGHEEDRSLSRVGYLIAFPLVSVCGLFLILDLERPERFWHMLLQSEVVDQALEDDWPFSGSAWLSMLQTPMLKWWSPMSIGAWALSLFGLCSFLSFVGNLWPDGRAGRLIGHKLWGSVFKLLGSAVGFFVASYTGALLTATNQPVWSASEWIAPLFLTSAASTGIATVILLGRHGQDVPPESLQRLERADLWALGLELAVFVIFLASLRGALVAVTYYWQGWVLVAGTLVVGLFVPLVVHVRWGVTTPWRMPAAAVCALAGGLALRYGIVNTPPELLSRAPEIADQGQGVLWETWTGKALLACSVILAIMAPVALSRRPGNSAAKTFLAGVLSLLVCAGTVYYVFSDPEGQSAFDPLEGLSISPEDGRQEGGGPGASSANRPETLRPRSKITGTD